MDVPFIENQPYFTRNYLQGENIVEEDNFLQISKPVEEDNFLKIPKSVLNMLHKIETPLHSDKRSMEISAQNIKEHDASSSQVPSIIMESELGGELLQMDQNNPKPKLQFYIRRKSQGNAIDPNILPVTEQLKSLDNGPSSTQGNSKLTPSNSSSVDFSDLDVPIATRKGVRSYTKDPIAKYLSYKKLSNSHKAFLSNISNLHVSRTIQDVLGDLDWKLAVIEEMNALKKMALGKLWSYPKARQL